MTAPQEEPFDWELASAKEAGVDAYYDLLNRREAAKARMAVSEASGHASGVEGGGLGGNTREGGRNAENATSRAAPPSKEPALSEEGSILAAESALWTWGHWIRKGEERVVGYRPTGYRSQFAPPRPPPPPPEESDLAAYVERTPGFEAVSEILWRVYVNLPNWEPVGQAKERHDAFVLALAKRLRETPWIPPRHLPEICEADRDRPRQSDEEWAKSGRVHRERSRKSARQ